MSEHPPHAEPGPTAAGQLSSRGRFVRGLRLGTPIFLGYVPVGLAFGVLARNLGFTVTEAVVCSATALAGAGQFIALSLMKSGATAVATIAATAVVNLRYVLFSTTLSPYVKGVGLARQALVAYTLTDETFAINVADRRRGESSPASMAGVGAIAWLGWVLGTLLGASGAQWIGDPQRWGMDFAMPAMFAALFVALSEDRRHVATGLLAGTVVLLLPMAQDAGLAIDSSWFIVIASLAGASTASLVFRGR